MTDKNTSITLQIQGKEYRVSCPPEDRNALLEASHYLNDKLKEAKSSQVVGNDRIAIMAALNITYELLAARHGVQAQESQSDRLQQLNDRMSDEIDAFNQYRNTLL